jgi:hypothetical protein
VAAQLALPHLFAVGLDQAVADQPVQHPVQRADLQRDAPAGQLGQLPTIP